jgi:two-component system cell cycle sensor histidine kinase/response regulator CckA
VMADPVQIEQVLVNLATNARDAMPAGGKLAIKTSEAVFDDAVAKEQGTVPGPHVLICVQDSGLGMDAVTQARIFEPFFTTKGVGAGTGLGLSTVFEVVRQFGGCILVESAVGQGSKFTVCIPSLQNPVGDTSSAVH